MNSTTRRNPLQTCNRLVFAALFCAAAALSPAAEEPVIHPWNLSLNPTVIDYDYDSAGQLTRVTTPESTVNVGYWSTGLVERMDNLGTPGAPSVTVSYEYDGNGNVVGLTQSIERVFGSCAASPELGFLYNNYMSAFEYDDPSHPYYLRPNAAPWASVAPTIVFRGRKPWLAIGSPGSGLQQRAT